ncbi:MAG: hypothetical protein ABI550_10030 [Ignavibacteriaceae bacterium]
MIRKLKLFLTPVAARILFRIGKSPEYIINKLGREATLVQIKNLFNKSENDIEKVKRPLDIIFMPYMASFLGNNMVQVLLAKVLKEMGHNIRVVIADRVLPICETTDISTHSRREKICKENIRFNERFFRATNFKVLRLSELVSDEKISELKDVSENNSKWDVYVESMLLRYFKVGELDYNDKMVQEMKSRARHAAFISEALGEAIAALNPERVAFSHGTYTTRGPFKDIINQANIPQFSISRAKMAETQKFNWKTPGDWWDVESTWEEFKNKSLNSRELNIVETYMQSRRSHTRDVMVYNFTGEESKDLTYKKLGISPSKETYTIFTNVLWDAASAQREIAFKNPVEWVIETIKWFKNHPEKQLVVRIHPAESVIGTKQPMYDLIKKNINDISSNVIILKPDAPVNSWSLLKVTDVGLVHTSTVGMELALEGIPCICVSKTHYRNKGFTIDITSREEYFSVLGNGVQNFDAVKCKQQALKYSYVLFMKYQIPLPFFNPKSHISINSFSFNNWKEVISSKGVKTIIDVIEKQSDFILADEDVYELHSN